VAPQVVVLTGRQPNELIGAPLQALVCEEDFDEAASLQRAIMERRTTCTVAYRLKRTVGEPVWVEATVHAVHSPERALTGFVGSWHDITERGRVEVAFEDQAYDDSQTSPPNRRLLVHRPTSALTRARDR